MSAFANKAAVGAAAWTSFHTIAANKSSAANINIANNSATDNVEVKVAISSTGAGADPVDAEIIETGTVIPPKGILKIMGEPMVAGETVKVYASAAGVSVRHSGFEK